MRPATSTSWPMRVRRGALGAPARTAPRSSSPPTSLPERILETGDPYPDQLARATAEAVAARAGDRAAGRMAWQSAGRTPEPWLGPDILAVIDDLAAAGRAGVLVCPAGSSADHLEVLYDLDVEARAAADALAPCRSPAPPCRTTTPRSSASWPTWSAPGSHRDARAPVSADAARRRRRRRHHRAGHRATTCRRGTGSRRSWSRRATAPAGKIRTDELAGVPVEAGPDTFLARVPWAADLCRELGLGDDADRPATSAARSCGRAAGCARCRPGWCWACRPALAAARAQRPGVARGHGTGRARPRAAPAPPPPPTRRSPR